MKPEQQWIDASAYSSSADDTAIKLHARITDYLGNGGLFNPEMMDHDKVRDLLLDCRIMANCYMHYQCELAKLREQLENQACIIRDTATPMSERERRMLAEITDLRTQLSAAQVNPTS